MAGHSRPKDGVASLAYVPAIHALATKIGVDARHKLALGPAKRRTRVAGHDEEEAVTMIKVLRASHATFTTPELDRQVDYYSDVLGLMVTERDKNRAFLATRTGLEAICLERGERSDLT